MAVADWLSLSVSLIFRLSGSLLFGPHVEVASTAVRPPDIYAEVATAWSLRPAVPSTECMPYFSASTLSMAGL